jgi:hypothetical protein
MRHTGDLRALGFLPGDKAGNGAKTETNAKHVLQCIRSGIE